MTKDFGVCYVNWCTSEATGPDGACPLHRKHPVLHSDEKREQWASRIRGPRPRVKGPREAALDLSEPEPGVALPDWAKSK